MADKQPYQLTPRTLALTDVIPTQDAAGANPVGSNTVQDVSNAIGPVLTAKVSLTATQVKAIGTSPFTLVPAPGAGKFIKILSVIYSSTFNTTAYATNTTATIGVGSLTPIISTSTVLAYTGNIFNQYGASASVTVTGSAGVVNQPAVLSTFGSGNPTAGDSPLDVYITYQIVTL